MQFSTFPQVPHSAFNNNNKKTKLYNQFINVYVQEISLQTQMHDSVGVVRNLFANFSIQSERFKKLNDFILPLSVRIFQSCCKILYTFSFSPMNIKYLCTLIPLNIYLSCARLPFFIIIFFRKKQNIFRRKYNVFEYTHCEEKLFNRTIIYHK